MVEPLCHVNGSGTIATKEPRTTRPREVVMGGPGPGPGGRTTQESPLRRALLWLVMLGMLGTGAELILLEHTETVWQLIPIAALAAGLIGAVIVRVRGSRPALRVFQALMLGFVAAGVAGLILHYRGNAEFELEMYPSMKGFELIMNSLKGATPALAPGTMAQLGLLGLAYTFRHPILRAGKRNGSAED
jgi:hypothetical protein